MVETSAGAGSRLDDAAYLAAGATLGSADQVWGDAEMILKVKEPLASEFRYLRSGLILFTYLHLAADEALTRTLVASGVRAIGYETIQLADGSLPLLAPMSEVAGRLAIQVGSWCLQATNGGRGVLLSGVAGVRPGKVVILGAGIAGSSGCQVSVGLGASVSILDINPARLRYVHDIVGGHVTTVMSNRANIEEEVTSADLVVGTVLIPGAKAPKLLSRALLRSMRPGSAFVDVSIDQGGCAETSRPTSHDDPIYVEEGVVHYCVTNMPGAVPNTATHALTNTTLSYALALADQGFTAAVAADPALRRGVNVADGSIRHPAVQAAYASSGPARP
jgi:alanine dehydrogenase